MRSSSTPQATESSLEHKIRTVAEGLRESLEPVVRRVADINVRPIVLSKQLEIDDSLTARLLRALRVSDSLATAREIPAPQGLRIFLAAAQRAGAEATLRERAEQAVSRFEQLLEEFPNGRAGFDTTIENWLPEGRKRRERAASQAIYKSSTQTLGYSVDAMISTVAIQPSANGMRCDALNVYVKAGLRRLRAGFPILGFGMHVSPVSPGAANPLESATQVVETLDGEREAIDPRKFLLRDFCDPPEIPIQLLERKNLMRFVLDESTPPLNTPATIAIGSVTRNAYLRYREEDRIEDGMVTLPRLPCRLLVQDVLLRDDVYPGVTPVVIPRLHGMVVDTNQRDEEVLALDRVDLTVGYEWLGWGLEKTGLRSSPWYPRLLKHVMARAGWDASRFRIYRCSVVYPMPFVSLTHWFALPPAPAPTN